VKTSVAPLPRSTLHLSPLTRRVPIGCAGANIHPESTNRPRVQRNGGPLETGTPSASPSTNVTPRPEARTRARPSFVRPIRASFFRVRFAKAGSPRRLLVPRGWSTFWPLARSQQSGAVRLGLVRSPVARSNTTRPRRPLIVSASKFRISRRPFTAIRCPSLVMALTFDAHRLPPHVFGVAC